SGGLSPGPFCVEFACSPRVHKGFSPLRTPTEKHAKEQNTLLSVSDQDGRSTLLGPRAPKAVHCSWGPGGRTVRDGKMQCVCVCPVSPPNICTCVSLYKNKLTEVSLVYLYCDLNLLFLLKLLT